MHGETILELRPRDIVARRRRCGEGGIFVDPAPLPPITPAALTALSLSELLLQLLSRQDERVAAYGAVAPPLPKGGAHVIAKDIIASLEIHRKREQ